MSASNKLSASIVAAIWDQTQVELKLEECPAAVRKTFKRELHSGKIVEIERERRGKTIIYEAEIEFEDHEYDIVVCEDGTLLIKFLDDEDDDEDEKDGDEDDEDGDDVGDNDDED